MNNDIVAKCERALSSGNPYFYMALAPEAVRMVAELAKAIRLHRDQRGDDRCWMDDELLYKSLPEGYTPPARDSSVELKNCERFIACRHNPATVYVSPEREIEELREWKHHVLNAMKTIHEWHSGDWAGDKEGWGFNFEVINWMRRKITTTMAEVAKRDVVIVAQRKEIERLKQIY